MKLTLKKRKKIDTSGKIYNPPQVIKIKIIKVEANTISLFGHRWNSKSHKNEL